MQIIYNFNKYYFRSPLHTQKNLRGSQNSLNRHATDINQGRDRPMSAYIVQGQHSAYNANQLQMQGPPPRSQSSRDIIRQEAKLQEMQEAVRRRDLRAVGPNPPQLINQYRPNAYNVQTARSVTTAQTTNTIRPPRPAGSTPNLGPNSPSYNSRQALPNYPYTDPQFNQSQYGQFNKQQQQQQHQMQIANQYAVMPKKGDPARTGQMTIDLMKDYGSDANRLIMEHNRQFGAQYSNGPADMKNGMQNGNEDINNDTLPARPVLPEDGYRESPPPPPPNTSTHPLYNKPTDARYVS